MSVNENTMRDLSLWSILGKLPLVVTQECVFSLLSLKDLAYLDTAIINKRERFTLRKMMTGHILRFSEPFSANYNYSALVWLFAREVRLAGVEAKDNLKKGTLSLLNINERLIEPDIYFDSRQKHLKTPKNINWHSQFLTKVKHFTISDCTSTNTISHLLNWITDLKSLVYVGALRVNSSKKKNFLVLLNRIFTEHCPNLQRLKLFGSCNILLGIPAAGSSFSLTSLEELRLIYVELTNEQLSYISTLCDKLKLLEISMWGDVEPGFLDEGFAALVGANTGLETIIAGASYISDDCFVRLGNLCPALHTLNTPMLEVNESIVQAFSTHSLRHISAQSFKLAFTAIDSYPTLFNSIETLELCDHSESLAKALVHMPRLTSLTFGRSGTTVTGAAAQSVLVAVGQFCPLLSSLTVHAKSRSKINTDTDNSKATSAAAPPPATSPTEVKAAPILSNEQQMQQSSTLQHNEPLCAALSHLTELRALELSGYIFVSDSVLQALASHCPALAHFNLSCSEYEQITAVEGLIPLCAGCTKLRTISLSGSHIISDTDLQSLAKVTPSLEWLNAICCSGASVLGLQDWATRCPALKWVYFKNAVAYQREGN